MTVATVGRAFAHKVHDAQQVFRAALQAMSRPGRIQALPASLLAPLEAPALEPALAATLLGLLDAETSLWLGLPAAGPALREYLRFHTGVSLVDTPQAARFAVLDAAQARADIWSVLERGSDEAPQDGATLLVAVPSLRQEPAAGEGALRLSGPGIETQQRLAVGGLSTGFWQARASLAGDYPRGIDLLLFCGAQLAAVPRSTRVVLEG